MDENDILNLDSFASGINVLFCLFEMENKQYIRLWKRQSVDA